MAQPDGYKSWLSGQLESARNRIKHNYDSHETDVAFVAARDKELGKLWEKKLTLLREIDTYLISRCK